MDQPAFPRLFRIRIPRLFRVLAGLGLILSIMPSAAGAAEVRQKEVKFPDGTLKERYSYRLDEKKLEIREGLSEEFYGNGAKKSEIPWKDGKENGTVVYYYQDGRKSYEANFREGKKHGFATVWHANGQKQWQTVFREGRTNGVWREWYPDGKKKFEANYSDGKLDGLATWWHENGRLWQERSFQDGLLVKGTVREWDRAGRQTFPPPEAQGNGSGEPFEPGKRDTLTGGSDAPIGKAE